MRNLQNYPQSNVFNEIDRVFRNLHSSTSNAWHWVEVDEAWKGQLDLPGFTKEEVQVQLDKDRVLHVEAKQPELEEGETREFQRSAVSYRLRLPRQVDAEKLSANLENGVLAVTLPKVTPDSQVARRIELN